MKQQQDMDASVPEPGHTPAADGTAAPPHATPADSPSTSSTSSASSASSASSEIQHLRHQLREREAQARELAALNGHLTVILESITDGFFSVDAAGRLSYVNATAETALRRSRHDLLGLPVWDAFPEARRLPFYTAYEHVRRERVPATFEAYYPPLGMWLESRFYPAQDGGIAVYFRDVSQRRMLEDERARLLELNRAITESLGEGVYALDADGRVTFLNAAAERMLGWSASEAAGKDMHELIHYQHADGSVHPKEACPLLSVIRAGATVRREDDVFTRRDGTVFPVAYVSSPLIVQERVAGAVLAFHDMTEQLRVNDELAERIGTLEAMFEAITDGISMMDRDGHIAFMNPAGRALLGLNAPAEATRFFALAPPERDRCIDMRGADGQPLTGDQLPQARILRGDVLGGATAVDVAVRALDGREMTWNISGAPIRDAEWRIIGGVVLFQDVTQRRAMERALEAHAHELEAANRRMDEFLGIASHELRTPMTTIRANVQLARRQVRRALDGQLDTEALVRAIEQIHKMLERSDRQVERQNRLVSDLLDVSRIQAGKLALYHERCDLAVIVREAVDEQRMGHEERTITLSEPAESLPLSADADRIGQVVTNFLTNALKYSPEDKPVAVSVRREGDHARVEVRDEGPGLPPEEHERIWERFHRAPGVEVLSGSGIGLGLGLYISKTIVERHAGAIGVTSTVAHGATFWFTLPLVLPS